MRNNEKLSMEASDLTYFPFTLAVMWGWVEGVKRQSRESIKETIAVGQVRGDAI